MNILTKLINFFKKPNEVNTVSEDKFENKLKLREKEEAWNRTISLSKARQKKEQRQRRAEIRDNIHIDPYTSALVDYSANDYDYSSSDSSSGSYSGDGGSFSGGGASGDY